jgi:hypothetical protein
MPSKGTNVKYYNKTFEINNVPWMRISVRSIKPFDSAEAAIDYIEKARKLTGSDIIPWLPKQMSLQDQPAKPGLVNCFKRYKPVQEGIVGRVSRKF